MRHGLVNTHAVEVNLLAKKLIRSLCFDTVGGQDFSWEVSPIFGHDDVGTVCDGCRYHVSIIRVWKV